jgi:hypothetical protein
MESTGDAARVSSQTHVATYSIMPRRGVEAPARELCGNLRKRSLGKLVATS